MTVRNLVGSAVVHTASSSLIIDNRVRSIHVTRGRSVGSLGLPNAGQATITVGNQDGAHQVSETAGGTDFFPGMGIVINAKLPSGLRTEVFTGTVDTIDVHANKANTDETITMHCSDFFRVMAQEPVLGGSPNAGDTPGQRINAILDAMQASVPASLRDIDFGTLSNLYDDAAYTDRPLAELDRAAISDAGLYWIAPDGTHKFRGRGHRHTPPIAIGDTPAYFRRLQDVTVSWSTEHVINRILIIGPAGAFADIDSTSIAAIGERDFLISDSPQMTGGEMLDTAEALLNLSTRALNITPLELNAARSSSEAALAAVVDLYDEVQVRRQLAAQVVDEIARIERITHDWAAGAPWVTGLEVRTLPVATQG